MNQILFGLGIITPFLVVIKYYQSKKMKLSKRISVHLGVKEAANSIKKLTPRINFKQTGKKTEKLFDLAASAEFGDLLAVALISGQNPRASLESISGYLDEKFKIEIRNVIRENAFGKPLMHSLREMSEKPQTVILKPLIRQMENAIERGTPLAEVSRIFAEDQRVKFRNQLMKEAAIKEIAMLIPVVFVVLPSVLAVALYPALTVLQKLG